MKHLHAIERVRKKFNALASQLDERGRRRWAAVEARSLGWGGISIVANATRMSDRTIRNGIKEIKEGIELESSRQRAKGAGRPKIGKPESTLAKALNALIEPSTRGDPMSPLRWTCKSTRSLSEALTQLGYEVSPSTVGRMLKKQGYSLQSNRKTREGTKHPDPVCVNNFETVLVI